MFKNTFFILIKKCIKPAPETTDIMFVFAGEGKRFAK